MGSTSRNAATGGDTSQSFPHSPMPPAALLSGHGFLSQFRGRNNPGQGQTFKDWIVIYPLLAVWLWVNYFVLMNPWSLTEVGVTIFSVRQHPARVNILKHSTLGRHEWGNLLLYVYIQLCPGLPVSLNLNSVDVESIGTQAPHPIITSITQAALCLSCLSGVSTGKS